jgi:hypothetical protein|tara:strand:+ start:465 stop:938 length:474 start_codon:yes stop_codon:yes gene_type:complete
MTEDLERQIIGLVASDRTYVPMSSFDGKLKRTREKTAKSLELASNTFTGERAYANIKKEDKSKARGMRDGIELFAKKFPKYGKILNGIIEEKRTVRETHLYFGMNDGKRLTQDDYLGVMQDLGLSYQRSEQLYPVVLEISRNMKKQRGNEKRSVLIG